MLVAVAEVGGAAAEVADDAFADGVGAEVDDTEGLRRLEAEGTVAVLELVVQEPLLLLRQVQRRRGRPNLRILKG